MSIIEIQNITKNYGFNKGVFDLSFDINKGEVFGFLGPNGAGKTTTIRQLMGFISPDRGKCFINGLDCSQKQEIIQKSLGYLPGEIAFFDDMKGYEFIKFIADMRGIKDLSRAEELIKEFDLDTKGLIKKMSKGMKQKVGIVCAFMGNSDVYILDEPTSGLDPLMQNKFVDLILQEKQKGSTILMSSHIFEEVEKTCDKIAIIKDGKLMTIDTVENIKAQKKKYFVVKFKDKKDIDNFIKDGFKGTIEDDKLKIEIVGEMDAFIKALARYSVSNIEEEKASLEEVFMHYYGGEQNA